jgi:hypothetical protein
MQYRPIHSILKFLDSDIEEEQRHRNSSCVKLLLEAGADLSLEAHNGECWSNTFMDSVLDRSIVNAAFNDKLYTMLTFDREHLNTY